MAIAAPLSEHPTNSIRPFAGANIGSALTAASKLIPPAIARPKAHKTFSA